MIDKTYGRIGLAGDLGYVKGVLSGLSAQTEGNVYVAVNQALVALQRISDWTKENRPTPTTNEESEKDERV